MTLFENKNSDNPTYRMISDGNTANDIAIRRNLDDTFQSCSHLLDNDFIKKFPHETDSRIWELQVGARLASSAPRLQARQAISQLIDRADDAGPDFLIIDGKRRIWIEAVRATLGEQTANNPLPENFYQMMQPDSGGWIPIDSIVIRICESLDKKIKKFSEYKKKHICLDSDVLIIAIGFDWRIAKFGYGNPLPYVTQAVFPVGQFQITWDAEKREIASSGLAQRSNRPKSETFRFNTDIFNNKLNQIRPNGIISSPNNLLKLIENQEDHFDLFSDSDEEIRYVSSLLKIERKILFERDRKLVKFL